MSDTTEEKSSPASDQKLARLRKEGQSTNIERPLTLAVTLAMLGVLVFTSRGAVRDLSELFDAVFALIAPGNGNSIQLGLTFFARALSSILLPLVVAAIVSILLLGLVLNRGFVFSAKTLAPDFNKLNPAKNLEQMFGRRGWTEVFSSFLILVFWFLAAGFIIWSSLRWFFGIPTCGPSCYADTALNLVYMLLWVALLLMAAFVPLEMLLQIALFRHEQRMTKTEVKRERKDNHGSPEIMSARKLLQAAANAGDKVYKDGLGASRANMCIYSRDAAIGVSYHPETQPVPLISAKAQGEEARALRDYLRKRGFAEWPNDKITAVCLRQRAGSVVPTELYGELAEAINAMYS